MFHTPGNKSHFVSKPNKYQFVCLKVCKLNRPTWAKLILLQKKNTTHVAVLLLKRSIRRWKLLICHLQTLTFSVEFPSSRLDSFWLSQVFCTQISAQFESRISPWLLVSALLWGASVLVGFSFITWRLSSLTQNAALSSSDRFSWKWRKHYCSNVIQLNCLI